MIRYLPAVVWIILLTYVMYRHYQVYRLYDHQLRIVRTIEEQGGIETGSTIVAINQRVRYIIRIALAAFGILIGMGALYGVHRPGFGQSAVFGICVISYFYLSEAATGYLTIRDKRVIDRILELDEVSANAAVKANTHALEMNTEAVDRLNDANAETAERLLEHHDGARDNTRAMDDNTKSTDRNTEARIDDQT